MPVSYLSLEKMAAWVALDPERNRASKEWWDWARSAYSLATQHAHEADAAAVDPSRKRDCSCGDTPCTCPF